MKNLLMGISAALAGLAITAGAWAQELQCSAEAAGELLCQQERLCECQYFTGGAVSEDTAGYRWDCGLLRPRCEAAPGSAGQSQRFTIELKLETMVALAQLGLDGVAAELENLMHGPGPENPQQTPPPQDMAAWEGLDPIPADVAASREEPRNSALDERRVSATDLVAWEGLDPGPDRREHSAGVPRGPEHALDAIAAQPEPGWVEFLLARPARRIGKAPVPLLGQRYVQQAALAQEREIRLELEVAALTNSLNAEQRRSEALEAANGDLTSQNSSLWLQVRDMGATQATVLDTVTEHTLLGVGVLEDAVAMTGLDPAELLPSSGDGELPSAQGGPFIPGDYLAEPDPVEAVETSLANLDTQIARWEDLRSLLGSLPLTAPLDQYRITSTFGPRHDPVNGRTSKHHGVDFAAPLRTPVLSTAPGKVVYAGWKGRFGRVVEIDHGYGIRTRFAHLHKILVKRGQEVGHREEIAQLGSSGRSTGPHVHYEVLVGRRPLDPANFLEAGRHAFKNADPEAFPTYFP